MTQRERVLKALQNSPAGLTGAELYDLCGSMRYGARILELRDEGWHIDTKRVGTSKSGAAIFLYRLGAAPKPSGPAPEPPDDFTGALFDARRSPTSHYLAEDAA